MLSFPHMVVIFLVVLVVFGPQKLPELARSFGKLMAEFRKASGDFRNAFEEEMRDLERQARIAELKKQVAEAGTGTTTPGGVSGNVPTPVPSVSTFGPGEPLVATPVSEAVPRSDSVPREAVPTGEGRADEPADRPSPSSHDQQQPV